MTTFARAIAIAAQAHQNQLDKAGQPYVLHPIRMALRMDTELERIVAVLHDVVEDTPVSFEDLEREGFPAKVLAALRCVTMLSKEEPYEDFMERAASNPVARKVKLADIEDNMDLRRLGEIRDRDVERLRKYHRAWKRLSGRAPG